MSPKSLFHLAYVVRVAGLTLGRMRFRECSKSFIWMLRICQIKEKESGECRCQPRPINPNRRGVDTTSLADMFRTCSGPNSEKVEFQRVKNKLKVKVDECGNRRNITHL